MPRGTATLGQVASSSAGVSGWSSHEQSRARANAAADAVLDAKPCGGGASGSESPARSGGAGGTESPSYTTSAESLTSSGSLINPGGGASAKPAAGTTAERLEWGEWHALEIRDSGGDTWKAKIDQLPTGTIHRLASGVIDGDDFPHVQRCVQYARAKAATSQQQPNIKRKLEPSLGEPVSQEKPKAEAAAAQVPAEPAKAPSADKKMLPDGSKPAKKQRSTDTDTDGPSAKKPIECSLCYGRFNIEGKGHSKNNCPSTKKQQEITGDLCKEIFELKKANAELQEENDALKETQGNTAASGGRADI
jgi:hypothetical protein